MQSSSRWSGNYWLWGEILPWTRGSWTASSMCEGYCATHNWPIEPEILSDCKHKTWNCR